MPAQTCFRKGCGQHARHLAIEDGDKAIFCSEKCAAIAAMRILGPTTRWCDRCGVWAWQNGVCDVCKKPK